ncbi:Hypothetical predicted protein [Mytilus galloprovincialis]|uniref:B box-type domain-containing protein n=1 Tax=Mytilus galloprovincialis TaxID=29158 RepID=A0A8B6BWK7_MYTGA|nr:Hypothetical predicted protein [Mytilus galloprovincialis]
MAFSKSILKAQTFANCQFCEVCDIKWKCINCNLLLCQLCNSRIHSKIESNAQHHVIDYKDVGSEDTTATIRRVNLKQMTCKIHKTQNHCAYCNECLILICLNCLTDRHKHHKYRKLEQVYEEKLDEIIKIKLQVESDIPYFQEKENDLAHKLSKGNNQLTENENKIKKIRNGFVVHADELLAELNKSWNPTKDLLEKELKAVRQSKDELEERKRHLGKQLLSTSASDIFATNETLITSMPLKNVQQIDLKQRKFIEGKFSGETITDLFGSVHEI